MTHRAFTCESPHRRALLLAQEGGPGSRVDGIDALLVVDDHEDPDGAELRQRVLLVRLFFGDAIGSLGPDNFEIDGGVRVSAPRVTWAAPLAGFDPSLVVPELSAASQSWLTALVAAQEAEVAARTVLLLVEEPGDFSTYRLRIVDPDGTLAGAFDPRSAEVSFSFKVECPTDFDCAPQPECPPVETPRPQIDYLARDFASFRTMMLSRLAVLQPTERIQSPATLRTTLVEALAYAADREAQHQDAVATEAYLGTARLRRSVRRHARLLGYRMSEGANARAFVHLALRQGQRVDAGAVSERAVFTSRMVDQPTAVPAHVVAERAREIEGFEALHASPALSEAHNAIAIHTWGDEDCCLRAGATWADLVVERPTEPEDEAVPLSIELSVGEVLVFEQVRSPITGTEVDADPAVRWAVRITAVDDPVADPLDPVRPGLLIQRVHWHPDDAPLRDVPVSGEAATYLVARGNVLLVDHGLPVQEPLRLSTFGGLTPPHVHGQLTRGPLTFASAPPDEFATARAMLATDARQAQPHVSLDGEDTPWQARPDLLSSGSSAAEFVVEMDDARRPWLRFGDDVLGRRPSDASVEASQHGAGPPPFVASYRVGNGPAGNVGAESITHVVSDPQRVTGEVLASVIHVRNPLPAVGGTEPERVDEVRLYAPQAFRRQERAVTAADWADVAARHPLVSRAVARFRWTGSWNTVFVYVDLVGGVPLTEGLADELREFLDRYRMAGMDLVVRGPSYVPLDISLSVCLRPGYLPERVQRALVRRFGSGRLIDGTLGFFHPDRFSFGQPVYMSAIIAAASEEPGVRWIDATPTAPNIAPAHRFKRLWAPDDGTLAAGRIPIGDLEIARCDSDPSVPEHGRIRFWVRNPVEVPA